MNDKTARLRRLLDEGWHIVDVASDDDSIDTTLRRGDEVVRLRFFKSEASELLTLTRAA